MLRKGILAKLCAVSYCGLQDACYRPDPMPSIATGRAKSAERLNPLPPDDVLFGQTPAMDAVRQRAEKIAKTNVSILICGEGGTGKEALARWIHANSTYSTGEFVKVNCAAIPGE